MLNPFPELLNYQFFIPTLLRLTLGIFIILFGFKKIKGDQEHLTTFFESLSLKPGSLYIKTLAFAEMILGGLLILGLLTQIAAIIVAIILLVSLIIAYRNTEVQIEKSSIYVLLLVLAVSIMILGAGYMAVDLPL